MNGKHCIECRHYQGEQRAVGNCTKYGYLVVSVFDGPRCYVFEPATQLPAPTISPVAVQGCA